MTGMDADKNLRWARAVQVRLKTIREDSGVGCYRVASHLGVGREHVTMLQSPRRTNLSVIGLISLCRALTLAARSMSVRIPALAPSLVVTGQPVSPEHAERMFESVEVPSHCLDLLRGQFSHAVHLAGVGEFGIHQRSGVPVNTVRMMFTPGGGNPTILNWRKASATVGLELQLLVDGAPLPY